MNKKIKITIKESGMETYNTTARFTHMGDDQRYEPEKFMEEGIPSPRARVGSIEDYNKIYALLMGRGHLTTDVPLSKMMEETGAGDPASAAQALADYLNDKARIK
tara:strand:- start:316 stop:630 length:315 start_codon:yes stop_codon:yes gene_type:complete